jgi:hydrogenase maturation protease
VSKSQEPIQLREFLVIGYGNELRGDDGVGLKVAAALDAMKLPGVRVIACHQLTPELAEPLSLAREVVFVDASLEPAADVETRTLDPAAAGQIMAHAADPRTLLALARDVFGRFPPAWWLTIPIENIEFGEQLSPVAQRGLANAIRKIRELSTRA